MFSSVHLSISGKEHEHGWRLLDCHSIIPSWRPSVRVRLLFSSPVPNNAERKRVPLDSASQPASQQRHRNSDNRRHYSYGRTLGLSHEHSRSFVRIITATKPLLDCKHFLPKYFESPCILASLAHGKCTARARREQRAARRRWVARHARALDPLSFSRSVGLMRGAQTADRASSAPCMHYASG